jgi:PEP-CTERM motif-containing protein
MKTLSLAILVLFGFAGNARADNVTMTDGSIMLEAHSFNEDNRFGVGGTSFSAEGRVLTSIPEGLVTGMDRPDRSFLKIESIERSPGRIFTEQSCKAATAPEPAGMLLLGTGLAAVAAVFRRRLKRSKRKPH